MSTPQPAVAACFGPFFSLWTPAELAEAVRDHQRAPQARWSAVAVMLVLWYWAFTNRRLPFCQLLYYCWHLVCVCALRAAPTPDASNSTAVDRRAGTGS